MYQLCLTNEKGGVDLIAQVLTNPRFQAVGEAKLVVSNYTREPLILELGKADVSDDGSLMNNDGNKNKLFGNKRITLYAEDPVQKSKLEGYAKFLKERQKAGVCQFGGQKMYLLPPKTSTELINCVIISDEYKQVIAKHTQNVQMQKTAMEAKERAEKEKKEKEKADYLKNKPKSNGLLGSLASKLHGTDEVRAQMKLNKANKEQAKLVNFVIKLEEDMTAKLKEFIADQSKTEIRLEPMEKDHRYVVHDVVSQFPDLMSASLGDDEERRCVVYKRGHQPPDVEIHYSKSDLRAAGQAAAREENKKKRKIQQNEHRLIEGKTVGNLIKLNTVKRDRRSVEEVMADRKKARVIGPQDGSHASQIQEALTEANKSMGDTAEAERLSTNVGWKPRCGICTFPKDRCKCK